MTSISHLQTLLRFYSPCLSWKPARRLSSTQYSGASQTVNSHNRVCGPPYICLSRTRHQGVLDDIQQHSSPPDFLHHLRASTYSGQLFEGGISTNVERRREDSTVFRVNCEGVC